MKFGKEIKINEIIEIWNKNLCYLRILRNEWDIYKITNCISSLLKSNSGIISGMYINDVWQKRKNNHMLKYNKSMSVSFG